MVTRTLALNITMLVDEIVMKISGGDMAIIKLSPGFKKGMDLDSLDRKLMTTSINQYKTNYGLIEDFSFKSNDINDIMNDME